MNIIIIIILKNTDKNIVLINTSYFPEFLKYHIDLEEQYWIQMH